MPDPASWRERYGSSSSDNGGDEATIPTTDPLEGDSGDKVLWKVVGNISRDQTIRINKTSRQWAVWDDSYSPPEIHLGPVPYSGDLEPLFELNPGLGLLVVLSRNTAVRGENVSMSANVTPKIYGLADQFELGWERESEDLLLLEVPVKTTLQSEVRSLLRFKESTPFKSPVPHEDPEKKILHERLSHLLQLSDYHHGDRVEFLPSPDGKLIAAGGAKRVWICRRDPLKVLHELPLKWAYSGNGMLMNWSPDSRFLMATAYEDSMWFAPSVIDMQRVAPPVLLDAIRVFESPRFSADSHWALCPTEESIDLFDLPTRGTACHFRIHSELSSDFDPSSTVLAKEVTDVLLSERTAPPWLGELALALVGWHVDEGGGLVELERQREKLEASRASIRAAEDTPLKRWALDWLVRFEGPRPVQRVYLFGDGVSDELCGIIRRGFGFKIGDEYNSDLAYEALHSAMSTGLFQKVSIEDFRIWGGVGLKVELVPVD